MNVSVVRECESAGVVDGECAGELNVGSYERM